MRILKTMAAAGLALSALTVGSTAQAHDYDHGRYGRDYRDHRDYRYDYDRRDGWRRGYGYRDGGYRDGWRHGWRDHRRCWTEWRHHRRITICR